MRRLRAVLAFCYDFVVGDDWRIALGVVVGLIAVSLLTHLGGSAWWLLPIVVIFTLAQSLRRASRTHTR